MACVAYLVTWLELHNLFSCIDVDNVSLFYRLHVVCIYQQMLDHTAGRHTWKFTAIIASGDPRTSKASSNERRHWNQSM